MSRRGQKLAGNQRLGFGHKPTVSSPSIPSSPHIAPGINCRYGESMTKKITVSLPDDLVVAAQQAVGDGRATSVSAYVAQSMAEHGEGDTLAAVIADIRATGTTPTEQDRMWAANVLGLAATSQREAAGS
jgi:Arc/MetJ-type ribon-helix-helix transcriptional regulator